MFDQFLMWCRTWNPWYLRQSLDAVTELHRNAQERSVTLYEAVQEGDRIISISRIERDRVMAALRSEESRTAALQGKINEQITTIEVLSRKMKDADVTIESFRRLVAEYQADIKKLQEDLEGADLENRDWEQRYKDLTRENHSLSCMLNSQRDYPETVKTKKKVVKKKQVIKKVPLSALPLKRKK